MSDVYRPAVEQSLYLLREILDWNRVFALDRFAHVDGDTAEAVIREGARFTSEVLAPTNQIGDESGSRLEGDRVVLPEAFATAYRAYVENGWPALDLPLAVGGQQLPLVVQTVFAEMVNGANVSFGMLPIMQRAAAWLLLEHGEGWLREIAVPALTEGRWAATICISEAQAGSDVGRIRTTAVPVDDDNNIYRLSGNKIFITYADHELTEQILHLVLARTPNAPPGTRGISLFAVPKCLPDNGERNGVRVSRVEHKMGLRASPTCALDFDEAQAYRVGPLTRGLPTLFDMVKLMRLEVAVQGVGVGQAALSSAWRYASERLQGGPPDAPPVPLIVHADVHRMLLNAQARIDAARALILEAALQTDIGRYAKEPERRADAQKRANLLLPVCKAWGSEVGTFAASTAVQVFGGHGYIADHGIEQRLRDSRVMSIYEGTNGIQAIDLVMRKLLGDGGAAVHQLLAHVDAQLDALPSTDGHTRVRHALQRWRDATQQLLSHREHAGAVATDYLQLLALTLGGVFHARVHAVARDEAPIDQYRRTVARSYLDYVLPETLTYAERVMAGAMQAPSNPDCLPPGVSL